MNLDDLGTQILYTTVPIFVEKPGGNTAGTAFIYSAPTNDKDRSIPLLVTCWHVVQGATRSVVQFTRAENGAPKKGDTIRFQLDSSLFQSLAAPEGDIAVAPLGGVLNMALQSGQAAFFRAVTPEILPSNAVLNELSAIEDVTIIGYPSGISDSKNATPLIRRGITSTPIWNDFAGQEKFLIDVGIFPGSSGSPVFILNQGAYATSGGVTIGSRILFIGMVSQTFLGGAPVGQQVFLNLGEVINSVRLKRYLDKATLEAIRLG